MGLEEKMMVSDKINRYIDELGLPSMPEYTINDVKRTIRFFIDEKKLSVQQLTGRPTLVPFFCYIGNFVLGDGSKIYSTGEGFSKKLAQIRCIGEMFERIPIFVKGLSCLSVQDGKWSILKKGKTIKNSNGLSYSLGVGQGVFNSYRELIERHTILDYWLKKRPCLEIVGINKWSFLNWISGLKHGLKSKLYLFPNNDGLFCSVLPPGSG